MSAISLLIKPAGGACNINCRYCFYRDEGRYRKSSCGIMSTDTVTAVFEKTLPFAAGRCVVTFQGGEPTLAGLDFFRKAVEAEHKYLPKSGCSLENALQTNGLLIDDEWAEFLYKNNFLVGISLDGPKDLHDRNRVDYNGNGTYDRVMNAVKKLKEHKVATNTLSVLTHESCKNAVSLYGYFIGNGLFWQQYIPCLDPLCELPGNNAQALLPGDYSRFLKQQFDCWYRDVMKGTPRYNRFFDNLIAILCNRQPEACDMRGICSEQLVVEADGSVYPCDFYAVDQYCLGNFNTDTLKDIENRRSELNFIKSSVYRDAECSKCKWFCLCRGGCRRHRTSSLDINNSANRNRFCPDYIEFFEYAYGRLCEIAALVLQNPK